MGMKCANCNKGSMFGHNVSHSKRRTQKVFKPNLHSAKIVINGASQRVRLCTKCLRMLKEPKKETKTPQASVSASA
jgi:large subunit ribosomal protein L28